MMLLSSNNVYAAKISGSVYDLGLDAVQDVIIEINSTPKQFLISKDGNYELSVGIGSYRIHAFTETLEAYEDIVINDNGEYTIDIVLTESLSGSYLYDDLTDVDVSSDIPEQNSKLSLFGMSLSGLSLGIILIIIILLVWIIISKFFLKKSLSKKHSDNKSEELHELKESKELSISDSNTKESKHSKNSNVFDNRDSNLDSYEKKILSIVKKEKRTTQKDIRKELPLSEAKISLVIADLENKGKIRKIKKGRGNIIIFEKD